MQPLPPKPPAPEPEISPMGIETDVDQGLVDSAINTGDPGLTVDAQDFYDDIDSTLSSYRNALNTGNISALDTHQLSSLNKIFGRDVAAPGAKLYNRLIEKFREEYDQTPAAQKGKTRSIAVEHFGKLWSDTIGMNKIARKAQMMSNMPNLTEADIDSLISEMEGHEKNAESPWAMSYIGDAVARIVPLPAFDAWRMGPDAYVNQQMRSLGLQPAYGSDLGKVVTDFASSFWPADDKGMKVPDLLGVPAVAVAELLTTTGAGLLDSAAQATNLAIISAGAGATAGAVMSAPTGGLASPLTVSGGALLGFGLGMGVGSAEDGGKIAAGMAYIETLRATRTRYMREENGRVVEGWNYDKGAAQVASNITYGVTTLLFSAIPILTKTMPLPSAIRMAGGVRPEMYMVKEMKQVAEETINSAIASERTGKGLISGLAKSTIALGREVRSKAVELGTKLRTSEFYKGLTASAPAMMGGQALVMALATNFAIRISSNLPEGDKEYKDWLGDTIVGLATGLSMVIGFKAAFVGSQVALGAPLQIQKLGASISSKMRRKNSQAHTATEKTAEVNDASMAGEMASEAEASKPIESKVFYGDISSGGVIHASTNREAAKAHARQTKSSPISEKEFTSKIKKKLSAEGFETAMKMFSKKKAGEEPDVSDIPDSVLREMEERGMEPQDLIAAIDAVDFAGRESDPLVDREALGRMGMGSSGFREAGFQFTDKANILDIGESMPTTDSIANALEDGVDAIRWRDVDGEHTKIINPKAIEEGRILKVFDEEVKRSRKKKASPEGEPAAGHPLFAGGDGETVMPKPNRLKVAQNMKALFDELGIPQKYIETIQDMFTTVMDNAGKRIGDIMHQIGFASYVPGSKDPLGVYVPGPRDALFDKFSHMGEKVNHVIAIAKQADWRMNFRTMVHEMVHMSMQVLHSEAPELLSEISAHFKAEFPEWTREMQERFPDQFEKALVQGLFEKMYSKEVSLNSKLKGAYEAFRGIMKDIVQYFRDVFAELSGKKGSKIDVKEARYAVGVKDAFEGSIDPEILNFLDKVFIKSDPNKWVAGLTEFEKAVIMEKLDKKEWVPSRELQKIAKTEPKAKAELLRRKDLIELVDASYADVIRKRILSEGAKEEVVVKAISDGLGEIPLDTAKMILDFVSEDGSDASIKMFQKSMRSEAGGFAKLKEMLNEIREFAPKEFKRLLGRAADKGDLPVGMLENLAKRINAAEHVAIAWRELWLDAWASKADEFGASAIAAMRDKMDAQAKLSESIKMAAGKDALMELPLPPKELDVGPNESIRGISSAMQKIRDAGTFATGVLYTARDAARDYVYKFHAKALNIAKRDVVEGGTLTSMLIQDGLINIARKAVGARVSKGQAQDAKLTMSRLKGFVASQKEKFPDLASDAESFIADVNQMVEDDLSVQDWKRTHLDSLHSLVVAITKLGKAVRDYEYFRLIGDDVRRIGLELLGNQLGQSRSSAMKELARNVEILEAEYSTTSLAIKHGVTTDSINLITSRYSDQLGIDIRNFIISEVRHAKTAIKNGKDSGGIQILDQAGKDELIAYTANLTESLAEAKGISGNEQDKKAHAKAHKIVHFLRGGLDTNIILNFLDGAGKALADYDGPLFRAFREGIHEARSKASLDAHQIGEDFGTFLEGHGTNFEDFVISLSKTVELDAFNRIAPGDKTPKRSVNRREELIGVYMASKSATGLNHLIKGNGFTPRTIAEAISKMTDLEKRAAEWMFTQSEKYKLQDFEMEAIINGNYVRGITDPYVHTVSDDPANAVSFDDSVKGPVTSASAFSRMANINRDALKSRTGSSSRMSLAAVTNFFTSQEQRLFRIHSSIPIAKLKSLLAGEESKAWRTVFVSNHGDRFLNILKEKLMAQVHGKTMENMILGEGAKTSNTLSNIISKVTIAQFCGRLVSALPQLLGAYIAPRFAHSFIKAKLMVSTLLAPGVMHYKGWDGLADANGQPISVHDFVKQNSGLMRSRSFSESLHNLGRLISKGSFDAIQKNIERHGMWFMQAADEHSAAAAWYSIYKDEVEHQSVTLNNLDPVDIKKKAISKADYAIERTQPNGDIWSTPDWYNGKDAAVKMLTMFTQSLSKLGGVMYFDTLIKLQAAMSPAAKKIRGKILWSAFRNFAIASMASMIQAVGYSAVRNGLPDDDKKRGDIIKDTFLSPLGPLSGLGRFGWDFVANMAGADATPTYRSTPLPLQLVDDIVKTSQAFTKTPTVDKIVHVGTVASRFFGLPGVYTESLYRSAVATYGQKYVTAMQNLAGANIDPNKKEK